MRTLYQVTIGPKMRPSFRQGTPPPIGLILTVCHRVQLELTYPWLATTYAILHGDLTESVITEKATSWRSGTRD